MRSATLMSFIPCFFLNSTRSGMRAIAPSSLMISQIAAHGKSPASFARSTAASVCPARSKTTASRALSGLRCPGVTKSAAPAEGSAISLIVRALSAALMPVVMPEAASTVTVKAVPFASRLSRTMSSIPSSASRPLVVGTHKRPRASLIIVFTASGVIFSAATIMSPSFSRDSSSATMTILPAAKSAMQSSTLSKISLFSIR